jgi:hypothetical protein
VRALAESTLRQFEEAAVAGVALHYELDQRAVRDYKLSDQSVVVMTDYLGPHPGELPIEGARPTLSVEEAYTLSEDQLADKLVQEFGGKRRFSKQTWVLDKRVELTAYLTNLSLENVARRRRELAVLPPDYLRQAASGIVSFCFGLAIGRWSCASWNEVWEEFIEKDPFALDLHTSPAMAIHAGNTHGEFGDVKPLIVDDPASDLDVIRLMDVVFDRIWGPAAVTIVGELCEILGIKELREYFRKPAKGGFWEDHVTRYSKSRRQAPIYWLLQSPKRNYALWLYYHRLDKDLLFKALVTHVGPKIQHENNRFDEMRKQKQIAADSGKGAKKIDKEIERQEDLISELREFEDNLRRVANFHFEPDLNDGVVLNIAPLHELVPWKEAGSYWGELLEGSYEWSSIGKQLRQKGMVK